MEIRTIPNIFSVFVRYIYFTKYKYVCNLQLGAYMHTCETLDMRIYGMLRKRRVLQQNSPRHASSPEVLSVCLRFHVRM